MSDNDPSSYESIKGAADDVRSAQWWLLFSCIVAGKNAEFATAALNRYLTPVNKTTFDRLPFDVVRYDLRQGDLRGQLERARTGNYGKLAAAFKEIVQLAELGWGDDPREWTFDMLMNVPGIGPKTAAMFRLFVNPRERVAALDTHVLKFLRDCAYTDAPFPIAVPRATPQWGPTYRKLQEAFLERADRLGITPRDLDFFVWAIYRNGGKVVGL